MNNLQKRIVKFSSSIYQLTKSYKNEEFLTSTLKQVIRSSTSVGANYSEAQSAISNKDFHFKIRIALKEMKETNYWLNFLIEIIPGSIELPTLEEESVELLKILGTISKKTDPRRTDSKKNK